MYVLVLVSPFFFFNDTATTEIYTLSLHDALPIFAWTGIFTWVSARRSSNPASPATSWARNQDRKSTRLNSSHSQISYAVFCLKKKKKQQTFLTTSESFSSSISRGVTLFAWTRLSR